MKKYKFIFVGDGWDDIKLLYNSVDIETECHSDKNYNIYEELYNKIDYLLIPSLWEGGPMSLLEAYAMGIPIIGANVGWINHDFEIDYLFDPNNAEQLIDLLNKILIPLETRRKKVKSINYEDYGKKLITMVKKLS